MILLDIKRYLQQRNTANLQEIALHFQLSPDVVSDMLQHWVRKGVIKKGENPSGCGSTCLRCDPKLAQVYVFV